MFLLVVRSAKVNIVELLFTCIERRKENTKMNDAIKPGSNFLDAKKNAGIRNARGDFTFLFSPLGSVIGFFSYEIIRNNE
jgi:hypothetical protein